MIIVVAETVRAARRWADVEGLRPSPDLVCLGWRGGLSPNGWRGRDADRVVLIGEVPGDVRAAVAPALLPGGWVEEYS